MTDYVAIIRKVEGTDYWVDVPDIPGCISNGKTIEEAKVNYREALALHMEYMTPTQTPRARSELTEEEFEDAVETYILSL
ncbi:hypothetical protein GCM10011494_34380 [Novosphingobium endophyticum]|uniref:HicB-like antitoxin of toxin-antitoxin system domain-containing protein n=1 Tax=Novosphingobium endophyticum TaxID=1955250 RepID=A0A916TV37_9SPHN|nr:type II toxin-antitoxin system HicB family antitoxin [Novosphingobium endophyticum]GGC12659.1 hypothetical protein GCM10011494_34380 [Novosphingobium endophyticum]